MTPRIPGKRSGAVQLLQEEEERVPLTGGAKRAERSKRTKAANWTRTAGNKPIPRNNEDKKSNRLSLHRGHGSHRNPHTCARRNQPRTPSNEAIQ